MNKLFVESGTSPPPHRKILIDLSGMVFGRWTVIARGPDSKRGATRWEAVCSCGTRALVAATNLRSGQSRSCGCRSPEYRARVRLARTKHGASRRAAVTPEYQSWINMRARCTNPNNASWPRYGGRGITVCDRWQGPDGFINFLADVGYKPWPFEWFSLHRIDNDGNYEPGNVKWSDATEQARNRNLDGLPRGEHHFSRLHPELLDRGALAHNVKLTEDQVRQIVRLLADGQPQSAIATRFGVEQTNISSIKTGKTWSHVTGITRS